jgi:hypothetical protein
MRTNSMPARPHRTCRPHAAAASPYLRSESSPGILLGCGNRCQAAGLEGLTRGHSSILQGPQSTRFGALWPSAWVARPPPPRPSRASASEPSRDVSRATVLTCARPFRRAPSPDHKETRHGGSSRRPRGSTAAHAGARRRARGRVPVDCGVATASRRGCARGAPLRADRRTRHGARRAGTGRRRIHASAAQRRARQVARLTVRAPRRRRVSASD